MEQSVRCLMLMLLAATNAALEKLIKGWFFVERTENMNQWGPNHPSNRLRGTSVPYRYSGLSSMNWDYVDHNGREMAKYPRKKRCGVCEVARSGHWCKVTIAKYSYFFMGALWRIMQCPISAISQRSSGFHVNLMPQVSLSVLNCQIVCPTR
jgi:hypothetical protein